MWQIHQENEILLSGLASCCPAFNLVTLLLACVQAPGDRILQFRASLQSLLASLAEFFSVLAGSLFAGCIPFERIKPTCSVGCPWSYIGFAMSFLKS